MRTSFSCAVTLAVTTLTSGASAFMAGFKSTPPSLFLRTTTTTTFSRLDMMAGGSTTIAPTREKTKEKTDTKSPPNTDQPDDEETWQENPFQKRHPDDDILYDEEGNWKRHGALEYYCDYRSEEHREGPFHIILLSSTFDKPKITVPYVTNSLTYVLEMPLDDAEIMANTCLENGMACLGTWSHEESLELGAQLQVRDIVCRVVPFCKGGNRDWQAKEAEAGENFYVGAGGGYLGEGAME